MIATILPPLSSPSCLCLMRAIFINIIISHEFISIIRVPGNAVLLVTFSFPYFPMCFFLWEMNCTFWACVLIGGQVLSIAFK